MPRYPFYADNYAGDFEDLAFYGGRHDFVYPRVRTSANRLPLWNGYAFPDHLYGPTDPDADDYQVTEDPGGLSAEEIASLSDGEGYPKEQPSPVFPLDVAGQLEESVRGFEYLPLNDVGHLNQYSGLPRDTIAATDGDLNPGLRCMLSLFQDTLTLVRPDPRVYWFLWYEIPTTSPGGDTLEQFWGQVDVYEYKWTTPGLVASFDPDVITGTLEGEEPYSNFKATTPYYYSGSMLAPNYLTDPTSVVGVLPLTHEDDQANVITNRFHRWKNSRFFLVAHPSDVPPIEGDPDADLQAHQNWIEQVGVVHLYDYEVNVRKPKVKRRHRWIKLES